MTNATFAAHENGIATSNEQQQQQQQQVHANREAASPPITKKKQRLKLPSSLLRKKRKDSTNSHQRATNYGSIVDQQQQQQTDDGKQEEQDIEWAAAAVTAAMEEQQEEPKRTVAFADDVPTKQDRRHRGWSLMRQHRESIILRAGLPPEKLSTVRKSMTVAGEAKRRAKLKEQFAQEIRHDLDFPIKTCVAAVLIYFFIGVVAYSHVFQRWSFVDALYFSLVTFCTVGYGDVVPTNNYSRIFTCFYALGGIVFLGIAVGILGSNLVESQVQAIDKARNASKKQVLSLFEHRSSSIGSNDNGDYASLESSSERSLTPSEYQAEQEETIPLTSRRTSDKTMVPRDPWYCSRRFNAAVITVVVLGGGASILAKREGWDLVQILYFCVVTGSTIGFGDYVPPDKEGRFFSLLFIPLAVLWIGEWITMASNTITERRNANFRKSFEARELTLQDLDLMDENGDGRVSRAEWLEFMLLSMNKVDVDLIDELRAQWVRLDVEADGYLSKSDLIAIARKKLHSARRKLELAEYKKHLLELGRKQGGDSSKQVVV